MLLLEAPSVGRKPQWKIRSFLYCENTIRPKLSSYSAAVLISVFGCHFDINTQMAESQAEGCVEQFTCSLGNISFLSPTGYFDVVGTDLTEKIKKSNRPENIHEYGSVFGFSALLIFGK